MNIADELEFVPYQSTNHVQICEIFLAGKRVGTERVIYPKSIANPFVPPIYQYLLDEAKPYGTPPVGDAPLIIAPKEDEDGIGCMIPGWSTIEGFVQALEMEVEKC